MAAVRFEGVAKTYPGAAAPVVQGLDLQIADGEFMVLVGPSGCGKSTTLRMLAGLEEPTGGRIWIGDTDVTDLPPADRGVAMVFQSYALYPHMTVAQNLGFGLRMSGHSRQQIDAAVQRAAERLQLSALLGRLPRELSGGQRQRVAIGRAIVREPKVFLFDEPLSNLDAALRTQMRIELAHLHRSLGTTIVYVTHDQVEAMTLGDRIAVFNQGRIEQIGEPMQVYRQPTNRFVAGFLGSPRMNFLPVQGAAESALEVPGGSLRWPASQGVATSRVATVGVRPEHLQLVDDQTIFSLQGEVDTVEQLGDTSVAYVSLQGLPEPLSLKLGGTVVAPARGTQVRLAAEPEHLLAFDAEGRRVDVGVLA
ncbi:sn-glycerol-3-phosphate ABC transporter ATP-binding protein UgpC [Ideonella sp. DXS29W]|uniref:Sn-glycerol-3-phosphate ABC transporter ATP-binding protein UgpC n=1 Tax=Ideonella lacteola TaxID=2984193 RepID=A0ABU9BVS5_9BURK